MEKTIAILGSTGSIGTQTLEVVRENQDIRVAGLSAGSNITLLEKQIREFHPSLAAVWDEEQAKILAGKVRDLDVKVVSGMGGLLQLAQMEESQILVTAIVGMIGIRPTIAAIQAGKDIALANKETLVTAGHLIMPMAKEKGAHYLHEMLEKIDEVSAQAIHENNVKRVIRALEYYHLTGEKISVHNERETKKESPYCFAYFVLNDEREKLYQRIEQRIDEMLENGLIEEVKALKRRGCTKDMVSMQGLGYKEILSYLDGEYSLEEAVYILKRDTRHFAKRQITWFKREHDVIWLEKPEFENDETKILNYMLKICKEKGIL